MSACTARPVLVVVEPVSPVSVTRVYAARCRVAAAASALGRSRRSRSAAAPCPSLLVIANSVLPGTQPAPPPFACLPCKTPSLLRSPCTHAWAPPVGCVCVCVCAFALACADAPAQLESIHSPSWFPLLARTRSPVLFMRAAALGCCGPRFACCACKSKKACTRLACDAHGQSGAAPRNSLTRARNNDSLRASGREGEASCSSKQTASCKSHRLHACPSGELCGAFRDHKSNESRESWRAFGLAWRRTPLPPAPRCHASK